MKMKRFGAIFAAVLLVVSVVLGACACGSSSSAAYDAMPAPAEAKMAYAETAAAMNDYAVEEAYYDGASFAAGGAEAPATVTDPTRKLIKNAYLSVEGKDILALANAVEQRVAAFGGYIETNTLSNPNGDDSYSYGNAYYTVRVPADKLEQFISDVEGLGNVTYNSTSVTDVTLTYTDIQSRKNSLLTEQDRLNDLMKQAESVEDLITIESRLSEVRYEIESIESQLRTYDNQIEYSIVNIDMIQVKEYTPPVKASVAERISTGFKQSLEDAGEFFTDLFVDIIVYSPIWVVLAVIVVVIIIIIKAIKKGSAGRKAKREAKKAEKAAAKAAKAAEAAAKVEAEKAARAAAKAGVNAGAGVNAEDAQGGVSAVQGEETK